MGVTSSLTIACVTYFIGTVSPGPASLTIAGVAARHGRAAGLITVMGVVTGSVIWSLVSVFGMGALLLSRPVLLYTLGLFGGFYLCWLGWRALRTVRGGAQSTLTTAEGAKLKGWKEHYFLGLSVHLTNPKALVVWMSVITLALPVGSTCRVLPLLIALGCVLIAIAVFSTYALVFSHSSVVRTYYRLSRGVNVLIAVLFVILGLGLLYRSVTVLLRI